jgi:3-hydroxybutyryl-CoA dehydratase
MPQNGALFSSVKVGDTYTDSLTITDAHLMQAAGLTGDFNPLHVNEAFAKGSRYGGRILHGTVTGAIMSTPLGMAFAGTAIGYLEQNARFRAPVRVGDTLTTTWTVVAVSPKPKHRGGVVSITGECRNQNGVVVVEADGKMLVGNQLTNQ